MGGPDGEPGSAWCRAHTEDKGWKPAWSLELGPAGPLGYPGWWVVPPPASRKTAA